MNANTLAILLAAVALSPVSARAQALIDGKPHTFRLTAPDARKVELRGQWPDGTKPLERGDDGNWSLTVDRVPSGVWEYSFVVDGVATIDPGNPAIKPMRQPRTSILHIPSDPPAVWDWQDVPHGMLHSHSYPAVDGPPRELVVYTPPGYETSTAPFPLLVLQHGSGDNQRTWTEHGKAHWIYDNLIAAGKAVPAVVLMINGHPAGIDPRNRGEAGAAFQRELLKDALPLLESNYRVHRDPKFRAVAGLSMGGGQTLRLYLSQQNEPAGQFGSFGAFSASVPSADALKEAFANPDRLAAEGQPLLWIACGRDDFLLDRNLAFLEEIRSLGIPHQWHLTDGDHSWPVWRQYLSEFVPLLFR